MKNGKNLFFFFKHKMARLELDILKIHLARLDPPLTRPLEAKKILFVGVNMTSFQHAALLKRPSFDETKNKMCYVRFMGL